MPLSEKANRLLVDARKRLRAGVPVGHSLVDEFLRERREEFLRDAVRSEPLTPEEIEALKQGGADLSDREDGWDPYRSYQEGLAVMLIESLSDDEFCSRLNLSLNDVERLVSEKKVYSVDQYGPRLFPLFQIQGDALLPGFERVGPVIPTTCLPYVLDGWWRHPNSEFEPELDDDVLLSPREWLINGNDVDAVISAIRYL